MYNSQRNFYLVTTSCCRAENFPPTGYGWNRATFSQPILPPAQGRWPMWTDTQPQKSKQTTLPASLQDGGPSLPTVYSFQRGLGGKYRPQRCLPYSSSAEVTSEVPPVPLEVNDLPIQGNTLGLNIAPYVFTKFLKRPLSLLRSHGIKIIAYLDDMLLEASSKPLLRDQINTTISLLQALGFKVNWEKSLVTPHQTLEFLGIEIDSVQMATTDTPISANLPYKTSGHGDGSTICLLSFTKVAIPVAPLFFRALQFDLISTLRLLDDYSQNITLSQSSQANIAWWINEAPN